MRFCSERGQMTVEAAFLIPVLFVFLALLLQPAILIYDYMVMQSAANQGLRLISTKPQDISDAMYERAIKQQLQAIPNLEIFHTGQWDVQIEGNETSQTVSVTIEGRAEPIPVLGISTMLFGMLDADGTVHLQVQAQQQTQPQWAVDSGLDPSEWVSQWD